MTRFLLYVIDARFLLVQPVVANPETKRMMGDNEVDQANIRKSLIYNVELDARISLFTSFSNTSPILITCGTFSITSSFDNSVDINVSTKYYVSYRRTTDMY